MKKIWTLGAIITIMVYTLFSGLPSFAISTGLTVSSVSPQSVPASYSKPVEMTLTGSQFEIGRTTVSLFQGTAAIDGKISNPIVQSENQLTFTLGTGLSEGGYTIKVSTPNETQSIPFRVEMPSIQLDRTELKTGYRTTAIQVTGLNTNFVSGQTQVKLLDAAKEATGKVTNVAVATSTDASFTLLDGLGEGNYTLQVITGEEKSEAQLTIEKANITSISPGKLPSMYLDGSSLVLSGVNTDFVEGATVNLIDSNGNNLSQYVASVSRISSTELSITLKAGLPISEYSISVNNGTYTINSIDYNVKLNVYKPEISTPEALTEGYEEKQITITGANTTFYDGKTRVTLVSANEFISSQTIESETMLSFNLKAGLSAGEYLLKIETGDEVVTTKVTVVAADGSIPNEEPEDTEAPVSPTTIESSGVAGGVKLTWNHNEESDLAGYNVYYGLTETGPFTKTNASLIKDNQQVIGQLTDQTTYYFYVEAVDKAGNISARSQVIAQQAGAESNSQPTPPPVSGPISGGNGERDDQSGSLIQIDEQEIIQKITDKNNKKTLIAEINKTQLINEIRLNESPSIMFNLTSSTVGVDEVTMNIPIEVFTELGNKNSGGHITIYTDISSYKLSVADINVENFKANGLPSVERIEVTIEKVDATNNEQVQKNKVANLVSYEVFAFSGTKSMELDRFTQYVERELTITKNVDKNRLVGVRVNKDGTLTAVPMTIRGNKAVIKSRTNSIYTVIENDVTFEDITNTWNKEQIEKLASKMIIKGKTSSTFAPNEATTRAQFAVLLVRSLGLPLDQEYDDRFSDVSSGNWFAKDLMPAVDTGIITGRADGTFAPNAPVSRAESAAMIHRAMKYVTYDPSKLDKTKSILQYKDQTSIGAWVREDVEVLLQAGIMEGNGASQFQPAQGTTRAQTVKLLDEFLKLVELMD